MALTPYFDRLLGRLREQDASAASVAALTARVQTIEDTYYLCLYYETLISGTSGTVSVPAGGTIVLDGFEGKADAIIVGSSNSFPVYDTVFTSGGVAVAATMDASGNYTLVGIPASYPVSILYFYKVKELQYDSTKTIQEAVDITPVTSAAVVSALGYTPLSNVAITTENVIFTTPVSNSTAGSVETLAMALKTQTANFVLAGRPAAGTAIAPTFRALVAADLPASTLTNTHIFVGSAGGVATDVALSGDSTITNAGVITNTAIQGKTITLATGFLKYTGSAWAFDNSTYALTNQTMYIGTTAVAINRSSAALALTGITSIDGLAATATALATGRTISITGDIAYTSPSFDGTGNVTAAGTLATVNSNVGSFAYATITVNAKGLITAASAGTTPITGTLVSGRVAVSSGTNTVTDFATMIYSAAAGLGTTGAGTGTGFGYRHFQTGGSTVAFSTTDAGDTYTKNILSIASLTNTLNHRLNVRDNGSTSNYILGVHTDDDSPWIAGFFNDTYSSTVPIFEYFGLNSNYAGLTSGDFMMGSPAAKKVAIYTNGSANPRVTIDSAGLVGIGTVSPTGYLTIKAGTATVAPQKFTLGTSLTTAEAGALEYDGTGLWFTNSTAVRGKVMVMRSLVSSAGTLTLLNTYTHYVFSGTTTTWTLPTLTGNTNVGFFIKNRGSGDITLNSNAGGGDIYDTAAVTTITITPGSARYIIHDGTYWCVE